MGTTRTGVARSILACSLACVIATLVAASASAAVRYAEPGGNGPSTTCPESDPCGIEPAIEDPQVADADEVILLPGTYDVGAGAVLINDAISVHPRDPGTRPTITGTGNTLLQITDAATVRDLNLTDTSTTGSGVGATLAVFTPGALVERVNVNTTSSRPNFANAQYACQVGDGTLRDSVCHTTATGANGFGVALGSPENDPAITHNPSFINVTAWGTATGTAGVSGFNVTANAANVVVAASARNLIARRAGSANSVIASAGTGDGSQATVTLTNSNFPDKASSGNATVTPAGGGTNQTAAPLLTNPDAGDFHEVTGSPTIDAGAADSLLGTQDLDFTPRTQGSSPDIGADEFFVPPSTGPTPDTTAPETQIASGPKSGKTKKKTMPFSVNFSANETSTFSCSLDGAVPTTCTSPYGGKVGKGSHDFEVTATDSAGNVDPSPATVSWKVKRKKSKHHHHGGHHHG